LNILASHLSTSDIELGVEVDDKRALFDAIGRHVERRHGFPHERVTAALYRREQAGSTGVGQGVAIPHARIEGMERILACYFRLSAPIAFEAPDGKPVSHVLTLLVPKPATDQHLQILAATTRLFSDSAFRALLDRALSSEEVLELLTKWDDISSGNG